MAVGIIRDSPSKNFRTEIKRTIQPNEVLYLRLVFRRAVSGIISAAFAPLVAPSKTRERLVTPCSSHPRSKPDKFIKMS